MQPTQPFNCAKSFLYRIFCLSGRWVAIIQGAVQSIRLDLKSHLDASRLQVSVRIVRVASTAVTCIRDTEITVRCMNDLINHLIAVVDRTIDSIIEFWCFARQTSPGIRIAGFKTIAEVSIVALDGSTGVIHAGTRITVTNLHAITKVAVIRANQRFILAGTQDRIPKIRGTTIAIVTTRHGRPTRLYAEPVPEIPSTREDHASQNPIGSDDDPAIKHIGVVLGCIRVKCHVQVQNSISQYGNKNVVESFRMIDSHGQIGPVAVG